jgi:2-polyprenyl-3-methyl-5-hydroxy-6-metoxy-1,4-benzoquinol methylase
LDRREGRRRIGSEADENLHDFEVMDERFGARALRAQQARKALTMVHEQPAASPDNWDSHWGEYAEAASLNPAQAYRRKLILRVLGLATARSPVRLLDLGSGNGDFSAELRRLRPDAEILGLDLSEGGVELSRKKVPGGHFFQQDFSRPLHVDASFHGWATHAVCSEVLEHVDDPVATLKNVRCLMAPGCHLVVTVPGGPVSAFDRHIGHRQHFTVERLKDTVERAGIPVAEAWGAGFPFFNLYRLVVLARGRSLIQDVATGGKDGASSLPPSALLAMRAFNGLFKLNAMKTPLGWQLVALGILPSQ